MRNSYALIIPFLLILLYGGCSNGNNIDCVELSSEILNSQCLAEDMAMLCAGLSCESDPPTSVPELFRSPCTATDCSTPECTDRSFTKLAFDSESNLFSSVILNDQPLGNVECVFFQNQ